MSTNAVHLNHYLTESPEKNARSLEWKGRAFNVLEKICWVALAAIVAVILAISFSAAPLTGAASLVAVGAIFSTLFFASALSYCSARSHAYRKQAAVERGVSLHLNQIAEWKPAQIETFLREQGVDPHQIPLDPLRQLNNKEPLRALLPGIARFNYLQQCAKEQEATAQKELTESYERVENLQERDRLRSESLRMGQKRHEQEAIPHALDAMVLLQIMQQPTSKLTLQDVGTLLPRSLGLRLANRDLKYGPVNDNYFIFRNGRTITLKEIEQNMEPRALRPKFFASPVLHFKNS